MSDFQFNKVEGGYALVKYTGEEENVLIPDTFQGEPVVEIGKSAFFRKYPMVAISLPNSLKIMKEGCFASCENLKEVSIPNSVLEMKKGIFSLCYSLKKVILPNQLKILPESCFFLCKELAICELPNSLERIEESAFSDCWSLKEIKLPTSVKTIESRAFAQCESLKRVVCTHSDLKIHKEAFLFYYGYLESSLEELPYHIWLKVDLSLAQNLVFMKSLITSYESFSETDKKDCISMLKRRKKVKEQLFLNGDAEMIHFMLSHGLNLTLNELDRYVEASIQQEKTEVTALFLDYKNKNFSITEVETHTENKEMVAIGLELPTLKQFKEKWTCSKVEGGLRVSGYKGEDTELAILPESLVDGTKIVLVKVTEKQTFNHVKKLVIACPLTEIPPKGFFKQTKLQEVVLPDTIKTIEISAFNSCFSLKQINFPPSLEIISKMAFKYCGMDIIKIPEGVKEIHDDAFLGCPNLKVLYLPKSLERVGKRAFLGCNRLLFVYYYATTNIEKTAFTDCGTKIKMIEEH